MASAEIPTPPPEATKGRERTLRALRPGDFLLIPSWWRRYRRSPDARVVSGPDPREAAGERGERAPAPDGSPVAEFSPCFVLRTAAALYCCKGPRTWRHVTAANVFDGTLVEGKAHEDVVPETWGSSRLEVKEYLLLDVDTAAGEASEARTGRPRVRGAAKATFLSLLDEQTGETREDLCLPVVGTPAFEHITQKVLAAVERGGSVVVRVGSVMGQEGVVSFAEVD